MPDLPTLCNYGKTRWKRGQFTSSLKYRVFRHKLMQLRSYGNKTCLRTSLPGVHSYYTYCFEDHSTLFIYARNPFEDRKLIPRHDGNRITSQCNLILWPKSCPPVGYPASRVITLLPAGNIYHHGYPFNVSIYNLLRFT